MGKTKKELEGEVKDLNERLMKLEGQVATLATVFKGMLEVAQEERSVIEKPVIKIIN